MAVASNPDTRVGALARFDRRWFIYSFAALAGGELLFALISGTLDTFGQVADMAGHLIMLPAVGAAVLLAQRRALGLSPGWRDAAAVGAAMAVAYIAGYTVMGPPLDFLLSIVVLGLACGVSHWRSLRGRVGGAAWCVLALSVGYAVGAVAGVGAAIVFGKPVNDFFGGKVTGFMGVVGMLGIIAAALGALLSGAGMARILGSLKLGEQRPAAITD
ncbi:MAG: hypothetical protein NVS9B1_24720 [Candidatus Dormibacteraceae bacterium]